MEMTVLRFTVEASKSRTGHHAERRLVLVFRGKSGIEAVASGDPGGSKTYSRGRSWTASIELGVGDVVVYVRLNRRGKAFITGWFEVYDHNGRMVFKAVLRRRKVRASMGDPSYARYVEDAIEYLGLGRYVRRYNWATGRS